MSVWIKIYLDNPIQIFDISEKDIPVIWNPNSIRIHNFTFVKIYTVNKYAYDVSCLCEQISLDEFEYFINFLQKLSRISSVEIYSPLKIYSDFNFNLKFNTWQFLIEKNLDFYILDIYSSGILESEIPELKKSLSKNIQIQGIDYIHVNLKIYSLSGEIHRHLSCFDENNHLIKNYYPELKKLISNNHVKLKFLKKDLIFRVYQDKRLAHASDIKALKYFENLSVETQKFLTNSVKDDFIKKAKLTSAKISNGFEKFKNFIQQHYFFYTGVCKFEDCKLISQQPSSLDEITIFDLPQEILLYLVSFLKINDVKYAEDNTPNQSLEFNTATSIEPIGWLVDFQDSFA